jgi:hypothetical protein
MVCEHLDTRDLISLFGISKTFKVLEGDIFYRSVYKKEFPMVYQGLISHGQPILQRDLKLLNRFEIGIHCESPTLILVLDVEIIGGMVGSR